MAKRLYVGNLNYRTTEDTLGDIFSEFGDVVEVTIIEGKGFGFVEFESEEDAKEAIENLNGEEVDGRRIRVDVARSRPQRSGGGGYRDNDDRW
ncbi:MAG: RNA-binding protein [Candidatus Poribacteria bacterium]|nr:RNA-binding protein [Candidatus Poribacteria bacterium]